ncbi:MAG TPA: NHLP family bacteriocin export ABC transporter peptidase/permease/ATPase subunit [Chloroflexia bacterium]|nr:NHLP family bacteriocin export ABC transporter peptidase/permease/ATPase subunit [Chloroflexia bacterium]
MLTKEKPAASPSPVKAPEKGSGKRVKTPTVLQMEAVECGAAALGIILAHYGRYMPLEELRVACGVSRDGSKALNIVKAARELGFNAKGVKREPSSLRQMPMPLIIHWNFNHFLVLEGFDKDKVYLNDPASGPRTVTYKEFDGSFTGVALTLEPGPDFVKSGKPFNTVASLRKRLVGAKKALFYVILAGLGLVLPGLVIPTFIRVFVDFYLVRRLDSWLLPLLIAMGITALLRGLLTALREIYLLRLETWLSANMSSKFLWHVLNLPLVYFSQRFPGDVSSRVAINDTVAELLTGRLAATVLDMVSIVFFAILMFLYDPVLTAVGIFFAALNLLALRYVSRRRVDLNQHLLQESGSLIGVSVSGLSTIETLKAIGRESDFFSRWAGYQARVARAQQKLGVSTQYLTAVPPLLNALGIAFILTIGSFRVMDGQLTVGMLAAFQSLMLSFLEPVNKMVELGSTLQEVEGSLKRLDDVLLNKPDPLLVNTGVTDSSLSIPKLNGHLELRNVSFGYSRLEPPLIENFNLTLRPGNRVALVGSSGSGKTTVAKLVAGLYDPWQGQILFDGKTRQEIPRPALNNSLAVVDQEIFLFEGTVRDNLTLWNPTLNENQLIAAASDACIHDDIAARPNGYNSHVAEEGTNFSGGQRQRLEIARSLTTNPTLLVLDEATSALDALTEKIIDENLRRRGCTCLIIAHRLSTIRDCDEIIVLDKGQIVQRGTHDELKNQEGLYAELIAN